jgi:hypothetical protein
MIGSMKWNTYCACFSMLFTFLLSLSNNEWITSFIRGLYAFIIVFILVYAIRFILGTVAGFNAIMTPEQSHSIHMDNPLAGTAVDLATPSDDELINTMLKQQLAGEMPGEALQFEPLQPQKLVTKENLDPEVLVRSLREMSDE